MNSPQEFRRLFAAANRLRASDAAGALATIVRTAGSTYRRPGTSMLVGADGSVTCPLAGGCPQHDLVLRARRTIEADVPEIARYDRDAGFDVLLEAGCGGELEVLIEPLSREQDFAFLDAIATLHERRARGFMATIFCRDGTVLSPRPQRLLAGDGIAWQDIGDPSLCERVAEIGGDLRGERAAARRLAVGRASMEVLFESLRPVHRLVIFGANEGAVALARVAASLGWSCVVADPSPDRAADAMDGVDVVAATPETIRRSIAFDRDTSVAAMTHNLERDVRLLQALAGVPLAYLGVIGSRERVALIRARLPVAMDLHAPAGLDIGSETPEEIALAVAAEIVACSHARTAGSLATSALPIHP
jgi:xanthine/CO dehydrogenase XdhC/CoxF family maturation factor